MQTQIKSDWAESELQISYQPLKSSVTLQSPEVAARFFQGIWDQNSLQRQEQVYVLFLNNHRQVIAWRLLSVRFRTASDLDVRLLASMALRLYAKSIIVAVNHPDGHPFPCETDFNLSQNVAVSFDRIGIEVQDQIIIVKNDYYSFVANNHHYFTNKISIDGNYRTNNV